MKRCTTTLSYPVLLGLCAALACQPEEGPPLRAKVVQRADELIGGPTARGKIGDILIENDRIRAIIGANGPGHAAGVYPGTLLDIDLQRRFPQYSGGRGFDAFAEAFPLANLLVVNPADPMRALRLGDQIKIDYGVKGVKVLKDGSDGEAVVRVEGHSAYMFDILKMLNRDFIEGYLQDLDIDIGGLKLDLDQIADLLRGLFGVNLFGVLNRLQIAFDFRTDYILHQNESFLTMRTTILPRGFSKKLVAGCPVVTCNQECPYGYVMKEVEEPVQGRETPYMRMCPVCECSSKPKEMPTLNEPRDIFRTILGGIDEWKDRAWKGGIVAGDFLFYGGDAKGFAPGIGFDLSRKVFEDMWQGVGTLGSPLSFDYLAGVANEVSYVWFTRNPRERNGLECPEYRIALTWVDMQRQDQVVEKLAQRYGQSKKRLASLVRALAVDRRPLVLPEDTVKVSDQDRASGDFLAWKEKKLASQPIRDIQKDLGNTAKVDLIPRHDCMPSKVLVPLYSKSATAVLTHSSEGDRMEVRDDGAAYDPATAYTFERYIAVGEGDVASALGPFFELRKVPHGTLRGVVLEEDTLRPISRAEVFLFLDPRDDPTSEAAPITYQDYKGMADERFGFHGPVNHFRTDRGEDTVIDGAFSGSAAPGRYLVLAHTHQRGSSTLVPVTIEEGQTSRVVLTLPKSGKIEFSVKDQGGMSLPAKVIVMPLDSRGMRYDWEGVNATELADPLYDHGIYEIEHSTSGFGSIIVPPGTYDLLVARGMEYGLYWKRGVVVEPGQSVAVNAVLDHELTTKDAISVDFHVHARNSVDASLVYERRVAAAVADGLEFINASDHDYLTDYTPQILAMGVEQFAQSMVSVETSPLEYGHFNGFPLRYDHLALPVHLAPHWQLSTIKETWDAIRALRAVPQEDFVLEVNHPRDGFMGYLAQGGVRAYDLERKRPGTATCNIALAALPCDFDAFEVLNGKHAEFLQTPTVQEVYNHNECYRQITQAFDKKKFELGDHNPDDVVCGFLQVDPSQDCDTAMAKVKSGGLSDEETAKWRPIADHCLWHRQFRQEMARCAGEDVTLLDCKRIALEALKYLSVRYMLERTREEDDAFWATTEDNDVGCSLKKALENCKGDEETCGLKPCTSRTEPLQNWFAFLNAGLEVTGVSNSDSHTVLDEIGLPRNYLLVGNDSPWGVSPAEVGRAVKDMKVVMSSGPYIEVSASRKEGGPEVTMGDTLELGPSHAALLRVTVRTTSWFKVDRVEVYVNGRLQRQFFPDAPKEALVDFDRDVELSFERDSWAVVVAYGLNDRYQLTPAYNRHPFGHILLPTVLSLGAAQVASSFGDLLEQVEGMFGSVEDLLGAVQLPDSYPPIPWAATNPVFFDVDSGGFRPPKATDLNNDGKWDPPPFCARPCEGPDALPCGKGLDCGTFPGFERKVCGIMPPDFCPVVTTEASVTSHLLRAFTTDSDSSSE